MKNRKNKKEKHNENAKRVDAMMKIVLNEENSQSKTDPNGSYTGVADPPFENVVQDADDL